MKEFIEYIVKHLVSNPEEVSISVVEGEGAIIYELRLNKSDIGKHQIKAIGYYTKKEQALSALAEYNNAPYKLNTADVTFAVIFEQWKSRKYQSISESNKHGYNMAFKHTAPLHDLRFTDIKSDKTPENTWITNILLTHC